MYIRQAKLWEKNYFTWCPFFFFYSTIITVKFLYKIWLLKTLPQELQETCLYEGELWIWMWNWCMWNLPWVTFYNMWPWPQATTGTTNRGSILTPWTKQGCHLLYVQNHVFLGFLTMFMISHQPMNNTTFQMVDKVEHDKLWNISGTCLCCKHTACTCNSYLTCFILLNSINVW